jgi:hypothetical protein
MSRNRNALVSHQAAIAPRTVAKWVASAEEVSQYLPSLTKGQQACVLAHAQYQKIPDVAKETGYSVHTVRQWLKTDVTFNACWHGMGRHVLEQGRALALNLARAAAPRAVLALQEIGGIPTYDAETGAVRPQVMGSVVRANETLLKAAGLLREQSEGGTINIAQMLLQVHNEAPKDDRAPWQR